MMKSISFLFRGKCLFSLFVYIPQLVWSSFVIDPGTPIQVANDNSVVTSAVPMVQTNLSGQILVIWQDGSNNILGSFSTDSGANWTPDTPIVLGTSSNNPFLASNNNGFLLSWVDTNTGNPFSAFYSSTANTWGAPTSIDPNVFANVPVFAQYTPKGFLTTFTDSNGNGYANLSINGTSWQSSSPILFPSSAGYNVASISGCGNRRLLLATWADSNTGNLYAATSPDGITWSGGDTPLLTGAVFSVGGSSGCAANEQGFLITYPDNSGNIQSIFSEDGIQWTSPSLAASNVANCSYQTVISSGNNSGFVLVWVDNFFTGLAAFSENNGQTWNTPVPFTPPGDVVGFFFYFGSTVVVSQDNCIFAWSNTSQNPYISISSFPFSPGLPVKRPWGLNSPATPSNPGKPLF